MAMRCHPVLAFAVHPAALGYILLPHSLQPNPVAPIFYVIPSSGEGVSLCSSLFSAEAVPVG